MIFPVELIELIDHDKLDAPDLDLAIQWFGRKIVGPHNEDTSVALLLKTLKHPSPVVRESSLYAISYYIENKEVCNAIKEVSQNDKNEAVKRVALNIYGDQ